MKSSRHICDFIIFASNCFNLNAHEQSPCCVIHYLPVHHHLFQQEQFSLLIVCSSNNNQNFCLFFHFFKWKASHSFLSTSRLSFVIKRTLCLLKHCFNDFCPLSWCLFICFPLFFAIISTFLFHFLFHPKLIFFSVSLIMG